MTHDHPSDSIARQPDPPAGTRNGARPTVLLPGGFTLTVLAGSALMTHDACGQRIPFMNPTPERIRWYHEQHQCGPPTSAWHQDAEAAAASLREAARYCRPDRLPSQS